MEQFIPNDEKTQIAVIIPCYNEGKTIGKVINDFRKELPSAEIFVFDNKSSDNSYQQAVDAGAFVIKEKRQGKGFVINSMLKKVFADIYVMVDGDDTYPADMARHLIRPIINGQADMVVGQRLTQYANDAFRPAHLSGNKLVSMLINMVFSSSITDPMSGYRAFTREVARELPIIASGFDVETEMTLQLLYRNFSVIEVEVLYRERPPGSFSKLNTIKDGIKILYKIFSIVQSYKPLTFFGGVGLLMSIFSIGVGAFVIWEFVLYNYIYSVPKAILAIGLMIVAVISISIGIILHNLNYRLLELSNNASKMFYAQEQYLKHQVKK